jgi:hypothetical protein
MQKHEEGRDYLWGSRNDYGSSIKIQKHNNEEGAV